MTLGLGYFWGGRRENKKCEDNTWNEPTGNTHTIRAYTRKSTINMYAYAKDATFFLACCSPTAELFSRNFGHGASKGAIGTMRRVSGSRLSSVAVL